AIAFTHYQRFALKRFTIQVTGDSKRLAQFSGTIGKSYIARDSGSTAVHQGQAIQRLQCPHQYRARQPFLARYGVEAPVHPVDEIDVGDARRPVKRLGACRAADGGVACQVVLAEVRLGLDDYSAGDAFVGLTLEHATQHLASDYLGLAVVKAAREDARPPARHYSLAVLLRLLRALRLAAGLSPSSLDADLRARRGLDSSVAPRLRPLRGFGCASESASSPVTGRFEIDSSTTGSGAGRWVSTTPTESRLAGTIPTRAPIGPRPRPLDGGALRAPMPVGTDGMVCVTVFAGTLAESCSLTEVGGAAGATS